MILPKVLDVVVDDENLLSTALIDFVPKSDEITEPKPFLSLPDEKNPVTLLFELVAKLLTGREHDNFDGGLEKTVSIEFFEVVLESGRALAIELLDTDLTGLGLSKKGALLGQDTCMNKKT